ncbi:TetR/AcrR family transcriptional regulator [Pseudooctadecabacter sp.]|uniref:TetR/AcrR family transcriptional regulator n=1 Tax=Pseudooctadecabacter sp. TaxID=1966338 RepID=UPI0035C81882
MTDTKTALLRSAEHAVRTKGFDGFSYADLAADVGIRKASIHHHFPAKADLSLAVMQQYHDRFEALCAQIDATPASGAARLRAMADQYRAALGGGDTLCLCVAFSISADRVRVDVRAAMAAFRAMMVDWLTAAFARGRDDGTIAQVSHPREDATAMLALLEGAQLAARAQRDPTRFDAALRPLLARLG